MISIILPVWNVAEHLTQCLRSIQTQPFRNYELIAVDDLSTDSSASILEEHAALDDRMHVIRLEQNVGLGYARNRGLREATGDYVWFIDSDDWLEPGALAAINERILATRPEVLIFDWRRIHSSGQYDRGGQWHQLERSPTEFRLADYPQIVDMPHFAWNKIVSRKLMIRLGLMFYKGRYQDIPFTYPVLAAAASISSLDRICINYRQHAGQTTRIRSDGHFDVFQQWARALSLVDELLPDSGRVQSKLFCRMIEHCFFILRAKRLPDESEARFFDQLVSNYAIYVPDSGYDIPTGSRGIYHRIAVYGSFRLYRALMILRSAGLPLVNAVRRFR